MVFHVTKDTWRSEIDRLRLLKDGEVYRVTVEPLTAKDDAYKKFHLLRDIYAERLGPRDKVHCKELLKLKYGPHELYAETAVNPATGRAELVMNPRFKPPKRLGQFVTFPEFGQVVYLVSVNDWTMHEFSAALSAITHELMMNGVTVEEAA